MEKQQMGTSKIQLPKFQSRGEDFQQSGSAQSDLPKKAWA
jgi:hypothetical protein